MHQLTIHGSVPATEKQLVILAQTIPHELELRYFRHLRDDPATGYSGPLVSAPVGVYDLWQDSGAAKDGFYLSQVITTTNHIFIGHVMVYERDTENDQGLRLSKEHHALFRDQLGDTSRVLHVYQNGENVRDRDFLILPHGQRPPASHPRKPTFEYIGAANLKTGRINRA